VSMTTNQPHPFALQQWLTIPFEKSSKTPIDELIDILLSLPSCLTLGDKISNQGGQELSEIESMLHKNVLDLISRLDCWRQRYCSEVIQLDGRRRTFLCPFAERRLDTSDIRPDTPQRRTYDNVPTAAFIAMYDAASLIAFSLLLLVSPPTYQYNHQLQFHAQSVLSADAFIESNCSPAPGGGSLLMVFPLKIVGLWGPLPQQRDYATRRLQNWRQEGESYSVCRFAAPVFLGSSTKAALSNVYHANVAAQIRLRQKSTMLSQGADGKGLAQQRISLDLSHKLEDNIETMY
jgi:hypothetical protein